MPWPGHPCAASLVLLRHGVSLANEENRFGGWNDDPLTPAGLAQARSAGRALKAAGLRFDGAYSSVLTRASETLRHCLDAMGEVQTPVVTDWRLNERHYGALQGLGRRDAEDQYGRDTVRRWRRGFRDTPPKLAEGDVRDSYGDPRYAGLRRSQIPLGECLAATQDRVAECWKTAIEPDLAAGRCILVVAHGNSLRALMMIIESLSEADLAALELPHATPIVYRHAGAPGSPQGWSRRTSPTASTHQTMETP